jgi:cobalt-zinc-cadmium efflux system outer membrane protein
LFTASCAAPALAQPTLELTLDQALARADAQAPEVTLADHALRTAQARRVGAGIVMPANPRLMVEARPLVDSALTANPGYAATIDTLFDVGGAPSARVREAERGADVAVADRELERLNARVRVYSAYVAAQVAALRIDETRAAIEIAQRVLAAAEQRVAAGAASELEQTSAALDLAQAQIAEHAALRERERALMDLRDALDLPADTPLSLTTALDEPEPLPAVTAFLERARRNHPLLAASQARLRSLEASRARLERELFPRMGLYAGVDAAPRSPVFGILGVSVELPVAQRNQGARAQVAREHEGELWRLELALRRVEREVHAAWAAHEQRRAELDVLTRTALPAAERSFALAEAGWQAGRFDWFRVALAAHALIGARASRLAALAATWSEKIALARASGGDAP